MTQEQLASIEAAGTLRGVLLRAAESFVSWSVQNPAYTQLLFWRPVPGFTPSAEAYAPAVELIELTHQMFADLQQRGLLRADADLDNVQRDWTVLISGVISQQLSNAPHETLRPWPVHFRTARTHEHVRLPLRHNHS